MNLYFFGGTFDPPHLGHYSIVKKCLEYCDKVVVIPNNISLDKKTPKENSYHRLNMLKVLFQELNVTIDDFEIISNKKNYTIHTIEYLMNKYKKAKITMVIGKDQLYKISDWYRYNDIINLVEILCFNRSINEKKDAELLPDCKMIENFNFDISSSKLRVIIKNLNNQTIEKYLDSSIIHYIKENTLYVK